MQDHPRIRGTNEKQSPFSRWTQGSSPHTRDKFQDALDMGQATGIIPAYAGQIQRFSCRNQPNKDHPRIRGTNGQTPNGKKLDMGSSPHTRDKSRAGSSLRKAGRIIPAYAGQMKDTTYDKFSVRDHPRIRGTNSKNGGQMKDPMGSSPHTRDKYREYFYISKIDRIIPAYAGQMLQIQISGFCLRDHPRIRGTNQFRKNSLFRLKGSSPHTRDK